ncbi:transporter substrate-binding domain-containing protein [Rhabdaerophilum sp. SD176]|uniref:transporter substrate-binding domain-containing protein n=1 Tax=Rhabdaerophilum sp. SD176 TaxID=2983548 RepID=UPI0024DF9DFD|nr:transporter substrate-binding domain-containing protein [Rhabdaerophilum sp. SD176]
MKIKSFRGFGISAIVVLTIAMPVGASAQSILDKIKQRGYVSCGASQGVPGLSRPDERGAWTGFDVETCRAVAVAVFADKEKARFVPLNAAQRLPALQTGEIDVLSRTTTWTFSRDLAVRFVATNLFDSDAAMVRKAFKAETFNDLNTATVCLQGGGSLLEKALDEAVEVFKIKVNRVYFDSTVQARDAYFSGRCDAYMTDGLAAVGQRSNARDPDQHQIISSGLTLEGLGVAIPRGDDRWFDIVRYAVNVLIWAEEKGITSKNVDEIARTTGSAEVKKVLGLEPGWSRNLGLDDKWAYNIIKQIGNYAEVWDRNLGKDSPLKAERGRNRLFKDGGLHFPIPMN